MSRKLNLSAPSNSLSSAIKRLEIGVQECCYPEEWLDLVEDEYSYLIALARLEAQRRKENPERTSEDFIREAVGER